MVSRELRCLAHQYEFRVILHRAAVVCRAETAADAEVRAMPKSWCGVMAQGPQAILPLAGLQLRAVHSDCGAPARHGRTSGIAATTNPRGADAGAAAPDRPSVHRLTKFQARLKCNQITADKPCQQR